MFILKKILVSTNISDYLVSIFYRQLSLILKYLLKLILYLIFDFLQSKNKIRSMKIVKTFTHIKKILRENIVSSSLCISLSFILFI